MLRNWKISWLTACFILIVGALNAQHTLFTQYDRAGFMSNPAWVVTESQMRGTFLYRNQHYGNGLSLSTSTLDLRLPFVHNEGEMPFAGLALSAMNDQAQGDATYNYNRVTASFAYAISLFEGHQLALGVQSAFSQKSLSFSGFTTGSQWVPNYGFNPAASQGESFIDQNAEVFRLSAGLLWYFNEEGSQTMKYYAGISAFNMNRPKEIFIDDMQPALPIRYMAFAGAYLMPVQQWDLSAEVLFQQVTSNQVVGAGPVLTYRFEDSNPFNPISSGELRLFARYMSSNTLSAGIRLAQKNYDVGFSYDLNMNRDQVMGAYEVSISLFKPIGRKKKQQIPEMIGDETYSVGQLREFISEQQEAKPAAEDKDKAVSTDEAVKAKESKPVRFELRKDFKFGFNQTDLDEDGKLYLHDIAALMMLNSELHIKVIGHTDNVGTRKANKKISEERAVSVMEYLISIGIPAEKVSAIGMSDEQPLYPNDTDANRAKNRRVEFIIYTNEQ